MRLLHWDQNGELSLTEFVGRNIPPYAILSHTWGADHEEVTFRDVMDRSPGYKNKPGYKKLQFCVEQAAKHRLQYCWVDTCCIDKSSSAELSEAINSMFYWYRNAECCYVYLADMPAPVFQASTLINSRWFTRGWTLQELIAPKSVHFFDDNGVPLGSKIVLQDTLARRTGIPQRVLNGTSALSQFSIEERFSWARGRETKREEDATYCLFGIFDVHMPLIYGEGQQKAMKRLRREIREAQMNNDFDSTNSDGAYFSNLISTPTPLVESRAGRPGSLTRVIANSPGTSLIDLLNVHQNSHSDNKARQTKQSIQAFVDSYYGCWFTKPYELHLFYDLSEAHLRFSDREENARIYVGREGIRLGFFELRRFHSSGSISMESLDYLTSHNNPDDSILVLVKGEIRYKNSILRRFVQSFVLKPNFTTHTGLDGKEGCILKDIFCLL